jgi:hypothetical protein
MEPLAIVFFLFMSRSPGAVFSEPLNVHAPFLNPKFGRDGALP